MKFTNVTADDLLLNGIGLVAAGESTPELTAEQAEGIAHQEIWAAEKPKPADKENK